ncbi:hypothetical protein ACRALDRAFT_2037178 [Sodiomyces alcalophilus JCM 7366]|uniref:uncharacterized protein n=1 Tax=Sodiomyces alcalophilus JCM 7366 TaxID=591952 RepID=UPI0039B4DE67
MAHCPGWKEARVHPIRPVSRPFADLLPLSLPNATTPNKQDSLLPTATETVWIST